MLDQITTQFYQNRIGEIFVVVQGWKADNFFRRLLTNVDVYKFSSEALYELSLAGFDNFSLFDPNDHGGHSFFEMLDQLGIESGETKLIASISAECGSELILESMTEHAKALFSPMLDWFKS